MPVEPPPGPKLRPTLVPDYARLASPGAPPPWRSWRMCGSQALFYLAVLVMLLLAAVVAGAAPPATEPPTIPVGLDAYRQWERWPQQRIGCRAYMRSTYDRKGGNESADASHFLFQLAEDQNVTLDVANPGILYFVRTNHWHGSPWHYWIDGTDHVIAESSTADPLHPKPDSTFLPADLFPAPLAYTWSATKGADLTWVPMGFERSLRLAYARTCYGTGYYIYHQFARGTPLSQPIAAWDGKAPAAKDVLDLIDRAGSDLAPAAGQPGVTEKFGSVNLPAGATAELLTLDQAPASIRAIHLRVPRDKPLAMADVRLRITWDGRAQPSVDAPLPLFFGAGTLYNRDGREHLVKAFPVNVRYADDGIHLACYFPMPFFRSARIELVNSAGAGDVNGIEWSVRYAPITEPANHLAYFHATYADHPEPRRGEDLLLVDTRQAEGGGDWTGSFVGTSFIFSHDAVLNTLEGDPRFYFDDSNTPQAQGTGTEEWGGGGDYWGGRNMTLPFAGHPCGARNAAEAKSDADKIESAYRFLLADLFPFGRNARITLEHGGSNESKEHYETVAYWYGLPGASLVRTDTLDVGDPASERAHAYASPQASEPYELTSRYEWGVDSYKLPGQPAVETYPATTDRGRKTTGTSQFTLKIDPANLAVMLRRKLDYGYPNQRAEVFVADGAKAVDSLTDADWQPAGVWYTAGSNTCVHSRPKGELDPAMHEVRVSNRRFRDDEFLLPRDLTAGHASVRVKVVFTPVPIPLFPGQPLAERAWSEMNYAAYSYVMPPMPAAAK